MMNISVIIPCFNASRYLSAAIESVLQQTWLANEIIVVDDGSTDDSISIASAFVGNQLKLITSEHRGIAATRNLGIRNACGDYLAFLDADDIWSSTKLEKQSQVLIEQPECQAVFGKLEQFISPELSEQQKNQFQCPDLPQEGYHAGCMLIRREAFMRVGLFAEHFAAGEFIEWYVRARRMNLSFAMPDDVVMYRRIHGHNTVISGRVDLNAEYLKMIRMKLQYEANQARTTVDGV